MINYDSIEIQSIPYARHFRYKNAITKHYDNIKDLNVIIKFHWYDEWEVYKYYSEDFYKCDSCCLSIPHTNSWDSEWWYNDEKNKCFRKWNYNRNDMLILVFIQNALWNRLQFKNLIKHENIYILLLNILPSDIIYLISDYMGIEETWYNYHKYRKKIL